jgi:hypothetical protein
MDNDSLFFRKKSVVRILNKIIRDEIGIFVDYLLK